MKYVVVLLVVVVLARIDWVLVQFDKASAWISSRQQQPIIQTTDTDSNREVVSFRDDASLKQTTRQVFLALLDDFHTSPSKEVRERALTYFKDHPTLFTQKLDSELEMTVFRWRDLLNNNDTETVNFLIDLLNILQGENKEMVKRFFSLWMEINIEHFLAAYIRTKDTTCMIATTLGDKIPEEEILNEYVEREDALKSFVAKDGIDPAQKALAANCLLVLNLEISKRAPIPIPPEESSPVADPNASAAVPVGNSP